MTFKSLTRVEVYSLGRYLRMSRRNARTDSNQTCDKPEEKNNTPSDSMQVHDVPLHVIIRPIPPILDDSKVQSLMTTLQNSPKTETVPPIDILWIKGDEGGDYYYSFGGCHRYEAHKRLNLPTIKGNLIKATNQDLKCYLGASTPNLK